MSVPDQGSSHRELNEAQQRRLLVTCKYIDSLLSEIEQALHSADSTSPFPRYFLDVTPENTHIIEQHIRQLRAELLEVLQWQHMTPPPAEIPVTRSVLTDLSFIDNAVEELKPRYLRGSGSIPPETVEELNQITRKLQSMVRDFSFYVRHQVIEGTDKNPGD
jgi:hypothetical protein